MKACKSSVLGYDSKGQNLQGGILGIVKGYYGCVEAQGCGSWDTALPHVDLGGR